MSHEIRTPLGVLGMSTLLHKTPLSAQQTEYLNAMQQAGYHLLSLLNDVLDMAKITAHHLKISKMFFELAELLAGAGRRWRRWRRPRTWGWKYGRCPATRDA